MPAYHSSLTVLQQTTTICGMPKISLFSSISLFRILCTTLHHDSISMAPIQVDPIYFVAFHSLVHGGSFLHNFSVATLPPLPSMPWTCALDSMPWTCALEQGAPKACLWAHPSAHSLLSWNCGLRSIWPAAEPFWVQLSQACQLVKSTLQELNASRRRSLIAQASSPVDSLHTEGFDPKSEDPALLLLISGHSDTCYPILAVSSQRVPSRCEGGEPS